MPEVKTIAASASGTAYTADGQPVDLALLRGRRIGKSLRLAERVLVSLVGEPKYGLLAFSTVAHYEAAVHRQFQQGKKSP
jgi:hypothetical protein